MPTFVGLTFKLGEMDSKQHKRHINSVVREKAPRAVKEG